MSKTVRYLITAIFLVVSTISHALTLKPDAPERYTVKKAIRYGELQSDIRMTLGSGLIFGIKMTKLRTLI